MFRAEIKRAIQSKTLYIMIFITTAVILSGYLDSWHFYQLSQANPQSIYPPNFFNAYEIFLSSLSSTPFVFFAILSAVLPYADSLTIDRESGYLRYATFRSGYWTALNSKFVANWLVGGITVALSMALAFGVACILFPMQLPELYNADGARLSMYGLRHTFFAETFETAPFLYVMIRIGLGFMFGATYATLGFAISSRATNRYIVLASPVIIFLISTLIVHLLGFYGWIPVIAILPGENLNSSAVTMTGNYLAIYGVSFLLIFWTYFQNWVREGQRTA